MNILSRTILEVKIGDRYYKLECSPDSPYQELNKALVQMNEHVLEVLRQHEEQLKAQEEPKAE